MQTNPAVEQNIIIRWSKSPCNQSGRTGKGLWRKGFAEEPSLEFRMKYWTSKRRCKRWQWRWWRWWTAVCDVKVHLRQSYMLPVSRSQPTVEIW